MATINYFVSAKKRNLVPIYVRLSTGRKEHAMRLINEESGLMECKICNAQHFAERKSSSNLFVRGSWQCKNGCVPDPSGGDFIVPTGYLIDPQTWSNTTQTIKQRIRTDADEKLIKGLKNLKDHIEAEVKDHHSEYSKEWLYSVIDKYHNKKAPGAKTLNDYVDLFLRDSESGERKNKIGMKLSSGTVRAWKVFKRNFGEFQGIYTEDRIKWYKDNKKQLRKVRKLDFEDITIDTYHEFVNFLSDQGYNPNTIGRHIKELKMFMKKSLEDKLHNNREFEYSAFKKLTSDSFSIYLTMSEIDKIYNIDLSDNPELDIARDAFLVLCETALRISDYNKVDVSIRKGEDGMKLIHIVQTKTRGEIVIPLSARLEKILKKYDDKLPRLPDQYINKRIKIIAQKCGLDELLRWESVKYGKTYEKTAYKWELVTCHTARRSACTNMYLSGIPSLSIMAISGHKTEEIFLRYIKVTPEQNARKLAVHPYFTGLKAV